MSTLILLQASTHSYAFAGLAAAAQSIAIAIGGPVIGTLADRHGHRTVAALAAIANLAAWASLLAATHGTRATILAAATLVGLTQPQVGPLVRVHWSRLLRERGEQRLLPTALAYEASADEAGFVAGPAVVGLLAPVAPFAPAALTMILIATATLPFALLHSHRDIPRPHLTDRPRPRLPRRPLAVMFLAMAAMGAVFGAVQTAVTLYADTLGKPGASGLLYAVFGIGSALTGVACAWLPARFSPRDRYVTFAAVLFAGVLVLFAGARLVSMPVAVAVAGCAVAPYMISLYALTERLAPPERAAVAMTVLCAGGPLGTAAGQAAAGVLVQNHGLDGPLLVALAVAAAALLLALSAVTADRGRGVWIVDAARPGAARTPLR